MRLALLRSFPWIRAALTAAALALSLPLLSAASGSIWLALIALALLPLWLTSSATAADNVARKT